MQQGSTLLVHIGIAEKGKLLALEGSHNEALRHYREALKMCQSGPNADVFFQHYSLCAMESLEHLGAFAEVIEFCQQCLNFLKAHPERETNPMVQKMEASLWERTGIQFLFLEQVEDALEAFRECEQAWVEEPLPLAKQLRNWALRGYQISANQIRQAQWKHHYFTVRKDLVNASIALEIPLQTHSNSIV